jgi:hypothetical protein
MHMAFKLNGHAARGSIKTENKRVGNSHTDSLGVSKSLERSKADQLNIRTAIIVAVCRTV